METLNTEQLSSRLRERLCEPAMLDLTKRLIAIPSENPPGNQYEECARTLFGELDGLGFDDLRRSVCTRVGRIGRANSLFQWSLRCCSRAEPRSVSATCRRRKSIRSRLVPYEKWPACEHSCIGPGPVVRRSQK